jgi:hypothetical protein
MALLELFHNSFQILKADEKVVLNIKMSRKELEFARQYVRANQSATATTSSVRFLGVGSDFR